MSKTKSNAKWHQLTTDQQDTLEDWLFEDDLSYDDALARAHKEMEQLAQARKDPQTRKFEENKRINNLRKRMFGNDIPELLPESESEETIPSGAAPAVSLSNPPAGPSGTEFTDSLIHSLGIGHASTPPVQPPSVEVPPGAVAEVPSTPAAAPWQPPKPQWESSEQRGEPYPPGCFAEDGPRKPTKEERDREYARLMKQARDVSRLRPRWDGF